MPTAPPIPDEAIVRRLRNAVAVAAAVSMAVGILGLAGWAWDVAVLKSVIRGYAPIRPGAALGHVLCGAALWLLRERQQGSPTPSATRAGRALALGLVALAVASLSGVQPPLTSGLAAVYFLLIGLALLCLDRTVTYRASRYAPADLLALIASFVAIIVFFDLLASHAAHTNYTRMSVQTAFVAIVVTFAVPCARARRGVGALLASSSYGGTITRRLWPANVFLPLFIGAASWNTHTAGVLSAWGAMTVMVVSMGALLALLTVGSAYGIDRSDLQRRRAAQDLFHADRALRALSFCNQALIRAADEATWLREVCRIVVDEAGYRFCWVGRADRDERLTVSPVAQAGLDEGYLRRIIVTWADVPSGRGPTGICIRTGQMQLVTDTATDARFAPWRAEALTRGFASVVAIPLIVNAERFGALTIYAMEVDGFRSDELQLLTELAADLAFGIEGLRTRAQKERAEAEIRVLNRELEDRVRARTADLEAAREREALEGFSIQEMLLLTRPPTDMPGVQMAALTVPSARFDGDFYAFFQHDKRRIDVMVADVMGKGTSAALLAGAVKSHVLEALCRLLTLSRTGPLPEPHEIVTLAHAEMAHHLAKLESFLTMSYARVDLNRRTLDLVDCGHTGTVVVRGRTGACEIIHGDNLPLGIREGELFTQTAVPFGTGDHFLFYSDGVTETRNEAGELFGVERLLDVVRENRELAPGALAEAVRAAALGFGRSERPADDLTCVAVRIGEIPEPNARSELVIRSDLRDLHLARAFTRDVCHALSEELLGSDAAAALELAVNEAASNIMKHAYHGRTDQRIHLDAETFVDQLLIRLYYFGEPFDPAAVAPPALDGSRESGFGVYLIDRSVDAVRYSRDEHGRNCVALVKTLATARAEV
jgi:serine phosphatase RsbU (regulator of sigma subunit)/anti-sigma regulatory factor (Ser/Thr protein kinase)